jgi:hypothetical protein
MWQKKITLKSKGHDLGTGFNIGTHSNDYKCLIHLDRLSITFRHWSGSTFQDVRNPDYIPDEQIYNEIVLMHDNSIGLGAFYHSYKVLFRGIVVGRLHSAAKLKKHEVQFDFAKEVFYSFNPGYWYEVYNAIKKELGIIYNNIMYMEVALDTDKNLVEEFGYYYQNNGNNNLRSGDRYKMRKSTNIHAMYNGSSFIVAGSENEIAIYNKTKHAEEYILNYFSNNGLAGKEVNRIEARLTWNYIRYLRNKKGLDINVETLTDQKKLTKIFQISTTNKITFQDTLTKTIDKNRNSHCHEFSITDNLPIETAEIGRLNPELRNNHYKTESVDENIMRQNYYRFLESGNRKYFQNLKASGAVASYERNHIINLISRFNSKYKGNRTKEITERMEYAINNLSGRPSYILNGLFYAMALKLKWNLLGMFSG